MKRTESEKRQVKNISKGFGVDPKRVEHCIRDYIASHKYLKALAVPSSERYGIDDKSVGPVSDADRETAVACLWAMLLQGLADDMRSAGA